MRLLKLGGISFLIASTIFGLISCEEDSVNLSCGPYQEFDYLDGDSTNSLILSESMLNVSSCFYEENNNYNYKIEPGNKYIFSHYYYEQEGPPDARYEEILLFEITSLEDNFYFDDLCAHKVYFTAHTAFGIGNDLYEGFGCISGTRFEESGSEGLKSGYKVNINIPTFSNTEDTIEYVQFSKKFYLAKGADD